MSPSLFHTPTPSEAGALHTGAVLDIDLGAIQRNWRYFSTLAPDTQIGACVKANAYGLGVEQVAPALARQGCRQFFVADPQEGMTLRAILPNADIYIMDGVFGEALDTYKLHRLIPCLKSLLDVELWCQEEMRAYPAALHVDTGMHRLGISLQDLAKAKHQLDEASIAPVLLMSHLACADDQYHAQNTTQLEVFKKAQNIFPSTPTSFANSAGLFLGQDFQGDIARPGIGLYGGSPFLERQSPFEPVVSLRGRVLQIQDVPAGDGIGYGA
ncbi:MAG: alanine racemase, partial [Parvibaculaceae bacterium]|nr:alanine racemase [Parvibaculaceae bacterium]